MTEKEIKSALKRLENDEDYYGKFGKQFLSNSNSHSIPWNLFIIGSINNPNAPNAAIIKKDSLEMGYKEHFNAVGVESDSVFIPRIK